MGSTRSVTTTCRRQPVWRQHLPRSEAVMLASLDISHTSTLGVRHFAPSQANTTRAANTWLFAQLQHQLVYGCFRSALCTGQMDRLPSHIPDYVYQMLMLWLANHHYWTWGSPNSHRNT